MTVVIAAAACGHQEALPTSTAPTGVTSLAPTTVVPIDDTVPPGLAAAPWSVPPLPAEAAPSILKEQWDAAGNKGFCAALYPADANDLAADAVVRSADFGADAWGIAWDRPEGPGRDEAGAFCEDCGRGAFGIAGSAELAPDGAVAGWPNRLEWSDGSVAGYGTEGLVETDAAHFANLSIQGQGCIYNAWSYLGEDHLLALIDELRFVEGMLAKVLEGEPPLLAEALGPAPWLRTPLGDAAVPPPLLAEWNEEVIRQTTCPLLTPVALGTGAEGAVARRAENSGEMLAAWDLPQGPGRYGSGDYCADCGRGVIGIGTISRSTDAPANFEQFAITHGWDDGSELRVISEATEFFGVSPDQAGFTDPQTEEPVVAPLNGYLLIPGLSCGYRLWSFLGQDHLIEFTQNLRRVIGYGDLLFTDGACAAPDALSSDIDGDGVPEGVRLVGGGQNLATLVVCPQSGPPAEATVAADVLAAGDADFDGDDELFAGVTGTGAVTFEILTAAEGGVLSSVFTQTNTDPLMLIEGVIGTKAFRWGCRDDGTLVQLEGSLRGGSLEWSRSAYRIEGVIASNVGAGSGTTPVQSSDLATAMFEDAVSGLIGSSRCEG